MNKGFLDAKSRETPTIEAKLHLSKRRGVYSEYELNVLIPTFLLNKEYDKINMQGISVYFNFQTEHYKKEYTTEDANKWHYVEYDDKLTELMEQFLPCHHKFEDTRLANERELEIFKYVLDNDLRDLRDRY